VGPQPYAREQAVPAAEGVGGAPKLVHLAISHVLEHKRISSRQVSQVSSATTYPLVLQLPLDDHFDELTDGRELLVVTVWYVFLSRESR